MKLIVPKYVMYTGRYEVEDFYSLACKLFGKNLHHIPLVFNPASDIIKDTMPSGSCKLLEVLEQHMLELNTDFYLDVLGGKDDYGLITISNFKRHDELGLCYFVFMGDKLFVELQSENLEGRFPGPVEKTPYADRSTHLGKGVTIGTLFDLYLFKKDREELEFSILDMLGNL